MRLGRRTNKAESRDVPIAEARGEAAIALRLDGVGRSYGRGRTAVQALGTISEVFPAGTFTAIMGPSGSGKSTLIQCAAGLDKPTRGKVLLGDVDLGRLKEPKLTETRRQQLGFVFQSFNLLPTLTVRQNIELPVRLDGRTVDQKWLDTLLTQVGLSEQERRVPSELSGGQQQRVAIARALISRPRVVFADEPTGALDTTTARAVLNLLRFTVDSLGQTLIMVTHDPVAASYADRVLFLANGAVVDRLQRASAATIAQRLTGLEER